MIDQKLLLVCYTEISLFFDFKGYVIDSIVSDRGGGGV